MVGAKAYIRLKICLSSLDKIKMVSWSEIIFVVIEGI